MNVAAIARPVLTSVAAHVYVRDVPSAVDFYTRRLGFKVDFVYGEPQFYAQVSRDRALLALRHVDEGFFAQDTRRSEELLSASLTLATAAETTALFEQYRDAGVTFLHELRDEPWGAKTFIVEDADGNLLLFAGPAE